MEKDTAMMYKKVEFVIDLIIQKKITAYRLSEEIKNSYGENIHKMSLYKFANGKAEIESMSFKYAIALIQWYDDRYGNSGKKDECLCQAI